MTTEQLTIRFDLSDPRETQAWFVPGARTEEWLEEIVAWNVPQASLAFRVIPRSRNDRSPVGVLVTVDANRPVSVSPRCRAYGRVGERFFLPVEAQFAPAIHDSELSALLPSDVEYVWHPVAGLAAFERGEVLSIADLLQPLPATDVDWDLAQPGESYARRLVSIDTEHPPSAEEIVQEGRDDIGTESESLDELPPSPEESQRGPGVLSGLGGMLGVPLRAAARLVNWVTGHASEGTGRETWADRLQKWAARMLTPEQQSARDREVDRLLNMLDEDPDRGLKYALPMGGDPARGTAPPSTHLSRRNVDFRLGSGSGPADPWHVDLERQQRLIARYRQLAEREIRLGRHRRAAYIYAELLGEYASAAAVLKSGGYFREAAVLYEERLHRPREAAECLEEGGLFDEAIARYEKLRDYEKVGQLYRKLEQHEEAEEAFCRAAQIHQLQGNLLQAAKISETELRDEEMALRLLHSGWPGSRQAQQCLHEEFRLLSRLGRHADAGKRVAELREQRLTPGSIAQVTEVLVQTVKESPDAAVRAQAADATRVIVARRLEESSRDGFGPERVLLAAVENLEPQDRLLRRDCQRYYETAKPSADSRPQPRSSRRSAVCERVYSVPLSPDVAWETAAASIQACFAAGFQDDQLILCRIGWGGRVADKSISWRSRVIVDKPILLAPSPNDSHPCWIQTIRGTPLPIRLFGQESKTHAMTPHWSSETAVALAQTRQGVSWMLSYNSGFVVSAFAADGTPILSRQIPLEMTEELLLKGLRDGHEVIPFHARSEGAWFAALDRLICIDAGENVSVSRHPQQIMSLSGSTPLSRVRVAVNYEVGGAVLWKDSDTVRRFGAELYDPLTAFTVSGFLIAVDASKIEIYRTERHDLTLAGVELSPGKPIAVLPVSKNEFAILDEHSILTVYSVSDGSALRL